MDEHRGTRARPGGPGTQQGGPKHTLQLWGRKHPVIVILAVANLVRIQPFVLLLAPITTCAACRQWSIGPIESIGVHPAANTLNKRVLAARTPRMRRSSKQASSVTALSPPPSDHSADCTCTRLVVLGVVRFSNICGSAGLNMHFA